MTRTFHPAASLLATTALAVTLSGCKIDNRPLLARGEPPVYAATPASDPGYAAQAAYLPPAEAYSYPQRAYSMSRVVRQRPPSYAFAYENEQPWAWDAADQGMMFAEPVDDGYRYYYYETGADRPYFVQDPHYSYAYSDGGVLLALFDATGALIGRDRYREYTPRAETYWTRAYDLRRSYGQARRYHVEETVWRERAPRFVETHDRWFQAASARPAWREAPHDNGRHLGWYKDKASRERVDWGRDRKNQGNGAGDDRDRRRDVAYAPAPPVQRPQVRDERQQPRDNYALRQGKVERAPHAPHRDVRHDDSRAANPVQQNHGQQASRDERRGQAVAPSANKHGQHASARVTQLKPDKRPQAGDGGSGGGPRAANDRGHNAAAHVAQQKPDKGPQGGNAGKDGGHHDKGGGQGDGKGDKDDGHDH